MKRKTSRKGFSLIELMIVITIVAILVALALPSYTKYVLKANRGEAQQLLLNWSNNQEIWRASHTTYSDGTADPDGNILPVPTHDKFTFAPSSVTATTYTLTATAKAGQDKDEERGEKCDVMTLDQSNTKAHAYCW